MTLTVEARDALALPFVTGAVASVSSTSDAVSALEAAKGGMLRAFCDAFAALVITRPEDSASQVRAEFTRLVGAKEGTASAYKSKVAKVATESAFMASARSQLNDVLWAAFAADAQGVETFARIVNGIGGEIFVAVSGADKATKEAAAAKREKAVADAKAAKADAPAAPARDAPLSSTEMAMAIMLGLSTLRQRAAAGDTDAFEGLAKIENFLFVADADADAEGEKIAA